jgi:glycosyltransferase involved in cell wall biosynthesis
MRPAFPTPTSGGDEALPERPRHITHVLSSFEMGGQERVALDLAAGQVRAGYRVSAVSIAMGPDGPLEAEFIAAGVTTDRVPRHREGVDPGLVVRLARWLRQHDVDLMHTHNRMALIYGAPAGRVARTFVVHTKHGKNPKNGSRLVAGNLAGRLVHAFVAVSPETADVARSRKEVDDRRLSVITNGIQLDRYHLDPSARARVRAELGIEEDAWVIGTVGRVAIEKNQALFIRALAPLLGPGARLVVAGDGPLMPSLRELASSLGVAPYVHLLGVRKDVPALLNALDAFVLSSITEGLPLVVPEAMASGLPVIATDVGGLPTVIDDGVTGYLVPSRDEAALRERAATLQADRALGRAMGQRARSVAMERFSAERMQRDYLDLYERVLTRRSVT